MNGYRNNVERESNEFIAKAPNPPRSSYSIFIRRGLEFLQREQPGEVQNERESIRRLAGLWGSMTVGERQEFVEAAAQEQAVYDAALLAERHSRRYPLMKYLCDDKEVFSDGSIARETVRRLCAAQFPERNLGPDVPVSGMDDANYAGVSVLPLMNETRDVIAGDILCFSDYRALNAYFVAGDGTLLSNENEIRDYLLVPEQVTDLYPDPFQSFEHIQFIDALRLRRNHVYIRSHESSWEAMPEDYIFTLSLVQ